MSALNNLAQLRGQPLTIRDYRYIDIERIDQMEDALLEEQARAAAKRPSFCRKRHCSRTWPPLKKRMSRHGRPKQGRFS